MEIKGIQKAVEAVEKKTGIDIPEDKIADTAKKLATKENVEMVKEKIGDVAKKIKK